MAKGREAVTGFGGEHDVTISFEGSPIHGKHAISNSEKNLTVFYFVFIRRPIQLAHIRKLIYQSTLCIDHAPGWKT